MSMNAHLEQSRTNTKNIEEGVRRWAQIHSSIYLIESLLAGIRACVSVSWLDNLRGLIDTCTRA